MANNYFKVGDNVFADSNTLSVTINELIFDSPASIIKSENSQVLADSHPTLGTVAGFFAGGVTGYIPYSSMNIAPPASPNQYYQIDNTITMIERFPFASTTGSSADVGDLYNDYWAYSGPTPSYPNASPTPVGLSSSTHGYVTAAGLRGETSAPTAAKDFFNINPAISVPNYSEELNVPASTIGNMENTNEGIAATSIEKYNFSISTKSKLVGSLSAPGGAYVQQPASNNIIRRAFSAASHSTNDKGYVHIQGYFAPPGLGIWSVPDEPNRYVNEEEVLRFPFAIEDGVATEHFTPFSSNGVKKSPTTSTTHGYSHGGYTYNISTDTLTPITTINRFSFAQPSSISSVGTLNFQIYDQGGGISSENNGYAVTRMFTSNKPTSTANFLQKYSFSNPAPVTSIAYTPGTIPNDNTYEMHCSQSTDYGYIKTNNNPFLTVNSDFYRFPFASETALSHVLDSIQSGDPYAVARSQD